MLAQFARWLRPSTTIDEAHRLYIALVTQARQPFFYETCQVPDSLDGRFDMVVLHLFLYTRHLHRTGHAELSQELVNVMFSDMDRSLREVGVGDMSVGKKVKKMADAWNGRSTAYEAALADAGALQQALTRNVYGTIATPDANGIAQLADYVQQADAMLASCDDKILMDGDVSWPQR